MIMFFNKKRRWGLPVILFILMFFIPACEEDIKDPISFKIIAGGPISGTYIVDNSSIITFDSSTTPAEFTIENGFYIYEKEFDELDYLEINAFRDNNTYLLQIKIYKDNNKVKESVLDIGNSLNYIIIDYVYGEEETT